MGAKLDRETICEDNRHLCVLPSLRSMRKIHNAKQKALSVDDDASQRKAMEREKHKGERARERKSRTRQKKTAFLRLATEHEDRRKEGETHREDTQKRERETVKNMKRSEDRCRQEKLK